MFQLMKNTFSRSIPYSASKIGADQLAISFNKSFNTPVGIIRPFNTYGPRQSNRAIIPSVINQILNGYDEIKVGNVKPTRDFSYVDDTVNGIIAGLESDMIVGKAINLGAGFEISIKETINSITEILGKNIKLKVDKNRVRNDNTEVDRLYSNNSLAKELLGWQPNYAGKSGFKKGLKKTIDWFSDNHNTKNYKSDIYNI